MRWLRLGHLLWIAVQLAAGQAYIVKFSAAAAAAPAERRQTLSKAFAAAPAAAALFQRAELTPVTPSQSPQRSAFPWERYALLRSDVPFSPSDLRTVQTDPSVEFLEPLVHYRVASVPNDSAYRSQWNVNRIGIALLYASGRIPSSLPSVIVGVIDTGIDEEHPDLSGTLALNQGESGQGRENNGVDDDRNGFIDDWRGFDFVSNGSAPGNSGRDNDPSDEHGHGTAVAGIIGAQTNNSIGIAGIAPVRLLPLRAFGKEGTGTDLDVATALVYAADNGATVVNMSFGDVIRSSFLHDAVRYAAARGVVLVASSGNDGSAMPHYPSDFPEVISVGSVGPTDVRSFFSSYSPSLDLMAPGEQIVTTVNGGGYTSEFSGTSAAAPHVAGTAALIRGLEKAQRLLDTASRISSLEELRGLLLNTADDAGAAGWDGYYGAGIVNAASAVSSVIGSVAVIHSPMLDEVITAPEVPIVISAMTPFLTGVTVSIGPGAAPTTWNTLFSSDGIHYLRDTVVRWNTTSYPSGPYVLRLAIRNAKGNDIESRVRVTLEPSPLTVRSFRFRDSVIVNDRYCGLVEARMDRPTDAVLFFRKKGTTTYQSIRSGGEQRNHSFLLTTAELVPLTEYEFYCEFTERSGSRRTARFPTQSLAGFDHFSLRLSDRPIATTGFVRTNFSMPKGFLLNDVITTGNRTTVVLNDFSQRDDFGPLKLFSCDGVQFTLSDSLPRSWVPRSLHSNIGNGTAGVLVQEHGVSRLIGLSSTVNGPLFGAPVWGDSSDIWAAAMKDLDGDGTPEIIARNSTAYLVYRRSGTGYSVAATLPNPSPPLAGEARNQFGPPRVAVGNFTGSGRTELMFADYDGDLLLYRQTASNGLQFELIGIDTTELFEMSDHLVAGDFTGDGLTDIAVAGHSNLDWNIDREYDAPVWSVRLFSHMPGDAAGSQSLVWQQHFFGVKAGSGSENGLSAGKLKTSDTSDVLFISFQPSLYIFRWNQQQKTMQSLWMHPARTNAVVVADLNRDGVNEFGFSSVEGTRFWSTVTSGATAPFGVTAVPRDSSSVEVRWHSSASMFTLYRGSVPGTLTVLASGLSGSVYVDSQLTTNTRYWYAVTAVAGQDSQRSLSVSVQPHPPLRIRSAVLTGTDQVSIVFSGNITSDAVSSASFVLDSAFVSTGIVWKHDSAVVCTFSRELTSGTHSLRIRRLQSASGMESDTQHVHVFNTTSVPENTFFVSSVRLLSRDLIRLDFNVPVDFATAGNPSAYAVSSIVRTFTVGSVDSLAPNSVALRLPGTDLTRPLVRVQVEVKGSVRSAAGIALNESQGQFLSIGQEARSLSDIIVYPNPAQSNGELRFINLPERCRITVYSVSGSKVAVLPLTTREGIRWDLRAEDGRLVSTGIYLYRIEQMNESDEITGTTMGKFAVIR